jgi:thiamine-phosphate diphosphorylase
VDSVAWIERLLEAGVRTIQLRIKDKRDEEVEADVVAAIALGRRYDARLFINDYWRLAIKHQAYGVHLGQEDLETTDLSAIRKPGCVLACQRTTIWRSTWRWRHALLHRARPRLPDANQTDAFRTAGADAAGAR